jgi:hypothetical protein
VSLLVAEQKRNVSACFNEDTCTYLHHVYHQVASGLLQKKGEEKGNHKGKLLGEKHKPIGHKNKVGMISQALNTKKPGNKSLGQNAPFEHFFLPGIPNW